MATAGQIKILIGSHVSKKAKATPLGAVPFNPDFETLVVTTKSKGGPGLHVLTAKAVGSNGFCPSTGKMPNSRSRGCPIAPVQTVHTLSQAGFVRACFRLKLQFVIGD